MSAVTVEQSRTIAVGVERAFTDTITIDLPTLLHRRHGPIPPIVEIRDQTGPWEAAGLTRTLVLGDGATMKEELTEVDRPRSFSYRITEPTGLFRLLIDHVDGRWKFDADGDAATAVSWRWTIHPRSAVLTPLVHVFGSIWKGMARNALRELEIQLTATG